MFTLDVCVCVNVQHCLNVKRQESVQTHCFSVCVSIDAMLNFDGDVDANANVKCEHSFKR